MTSEIVIHTERLVLRHARDDDLAMVYAIMSDPEVLRYWSTLPHESLGQTREWLNCMIARNASGNPDFLIEHNGQIIGKMGAYAMPEFGFYLAKAAQRQGFATEAMDAFIAHIFDGISDYCFVPW